MRQLLQKETGNSYHKFITKCDRSLLQSSSGITKSDRNLLQSVSGITKCHSYYKLRRNTEIIGLKYQVKQYCINKNNMYCTQR